MFKFLNNVPIFRRLFIIFGLATIIPVVVIVVLGNFFLNTLNQSNQAVAISSVAQSVAAQEQNDLLSMNQLLQDLVNNTIAKESGVVKDSSLAASGALIAGQITAREIDFQETLPTYESTYEIATSPNMSTIRNIIQSNAQPNTPAYTVIHDQDTALDKVIAGQEWIHYQGLQDTVMKQIITLQNTPATQVNLPAAYEQIYATLYEADLQFTPLTLDWQTIVNTASTTENAVTVVGEAQTHPVSFAIGIAIASILVIMLIAALVVNLTITQRLGRLALLTRRFITGDTSVRADIMGRDEINTVATSMNLMLDNIVKLIHDAERQRDELQAQVEKLLSEVSGVGEGDLRVQAEITTGTLGALADSFNFMVEELSNLVVRVKMVAGEVENGTTMTLERMTQLVESADTQISQIRQATTEITQMAQSSQQVAERAQTLYNSALEARQTAQAGRQSVQLSVEGIGRIQEYVQDTSNKVQTLGERSRTINNVVDVIANIAHQTNRLSLDAAIQAAMAGESGKGFRAVADDIRRLAEESKTQAQSITYLVRSVRDDIGALAVSMKDTERETHAGTNLTQQTGLSLDEIFGVVEQQAQEIAIINQAARQQSQSSNTVVQIMQGVSNSTQQNTASTHIVEQSMERLAHLAQQLQTSVGAFKLRENRGRTNDGRNIQGILQNGANGYRLLPNSRPLSNSMETAQPTNTRRSPHITAPVRSNDSFTPYPSPSQPQKQNDGQRGYSSPLPNQDNNPAQRR